MSRLKGKPLDDIQRQIEVMSAYRDGQAIQSKPHGQGNWGDVSHPHWQWNAMDYRVKPNVGECYVVFTESGMPAGMYDFTPEGDLFAAAHCARINGWYAPFSAPRPA